MKAAEFREEYSKLRNVSNGANRARLAIIARGIESLMLREEQKIRNSYSAAGVPYPGDDKIK